MFDHSHGPEADQLATDREVIRASIDAVLLTLELNVCCHGHKYMTLLAAAHIYAQGATKEQLADNTYNAELIADELIAAAKARRA